MMNGSVSYNEAVVKSDLTSQYLRFYTSLNTYEDVTSTKIQTWDSVSSNLALSVGTENHGIFNITQIILGASSRSYTQELESDSTYILIIVRRNIDVPANCGMYIIQCGSNGNNAVRTIVASATTMIDSIPSVSGTTLTITTGTNGSGGRATLMRIR